MKTNIQQLICIHNNDTNQDTYFVEKNNEWVKITQEEYDIIRGKKWWKNTLLQKEKNIY